jgi:hypothetical protein
MAIAAMLNDVFINGSSSCRLRRFEHATSMLDVADAMPCSHTAHTPARKFAVGADFIRGLRN